MGDGRCMIERAGFGMGSKGRRSIRLSPDLENCREVGSGTIFGILTGRLLPNLASKLVPNMILAYAL